MSLAVSIASKNGTIPAGIANFNPFLNKIN